MRKNIIDTLVSLFYRLEQRELSILSKSIYSLKKEDRDFAYITIYDMFLEIRRSLPDKEFEINEEHATKIKVIIENTKTMSNVKDNNIFLINCRYLYRKILNLLNEYMLNHKSIQDLYKILQNVVFLFDKALYSECLDLINEGKKLANTLNKYNLLLELIHYEKKIYLIFNTSKNKDLLKNLFTDEKSYLGLLQEYLQVVKLNSDLIIGQWNNFEFGSISNIEIDTVCKVLAEQYPCDVFEINYLKKLTKALWAKYSINKGRNFIENDIFNFQKEAFDLFTSNTLIINEDANRYFKAMSIFVTTCFELNKKEEILKIFLSLKSTEVKTQIKKLKDEDWFQNILYIKLS